MQYCPHEFQSWATSQIVRRRHFGLLLPMGLGKTVIILTALKELITDRFDVRRCLIIAPLRVARDTWSQELNKWDHLKGSMSISKILGSETERLNALLVPADIYVINRENVEWLVSVRVWDFDCVVIDELSSFKSHTSKRFKSLRRVLPRITRLYGLTGTPAPNGLLDLWSQIYLLDRGFRLLKGITAYRNKWFVPKQSDPRNPAIIWEWTPKEGASHEIYDRLADITVSVESGLVKLPPRIDTNHFVDIPMDDYDSMLKDYIADGDILAANAAVRINKLLQICNGAIFDETGTARYIHTAKLDMLEDLIEAANGRNVLVYYQFTFDLKSILGRFKTAREIRTPVSVSDWMAGKINLGVAHAASTGHGLNMQSGGNIIIWYGVPWSLELYQQACARLHRQGQISTVFIHHILAADTVDVDVLDRLHGKDISQRELLLKLLRTK